MDTLARPLALEPGEEFIEALRGLGCVPGQHSKPRQHGTGPFASLVLRNANLIDGTGSPVSGPYDVVVKGNRIAEILSPGIGHVALPGQMEIDCSSKYVMPGIVDSHVHTCNPHQFTCGTVDGADYAYLLWLAHGITSVRDCGALMGLEWTLEEKRRSAANEADAPRLFVYALLPWPTLSGITHEEQTLAWIDKAAQKDIDGIKFFGSNPAVSRTLYAEARRRGLRTACHNTICFTHRFNALDAARAGLTSIEHLLGITEALSETGTVQNFPVDYNFDNEAMRALQDFHMWEMVNPGGSKWCEVIDEMISLGVTLVPTLTVWEQAMDVQRAMWSEWHRDYTSPTLRRFFDPSPYSHWSFYSDWTTSMEIICKRMNWKRLAFVQDYESRGGRVTIGSDCGFSFKLYGFETIRELELLQEAGLHPLEVIQAATLRGAELLGVDDQLGSIEVGKLADILVLDENPLPNFKLLYGTGHLRLDEAAKQPRRVTALAYTIKDGIVYRPQELLAEVRTMVEEEKQREEELAKISSEL